MPVSSKRMLASYGAACLMLCGIETARSQTPNPVPAPEATATPAPAAPAAPAPAPAASGPKMLPEVEVTAPRTAKPRPPKTRVTAGRPREEPGAPPPVSPAAQLAGKSSVFDQARSNLFTTNGTTSDTISHQTIQDLPGGDAAPVEKVLLQAPGVSQDSAASGSLHVRNDHANVQYRINGIMLPDGVTGFGSIFDTSFIGTMTLVTGALPAEYGLRTVGLVDMTTRSDIFNNSGSVGIYGGSHGTITPSFEYGGTFGSNCPATPATTPTYVKAPAASADCFAGVQYYFTGRYLQTTLGLEPPTGAYNAIHDFSQQEKGFAYMSAFIDPTTRVSLIAGTSNNNFQIPNNPGQPIGTLGNPPVTSAFGINSFNSAQLNENQWEVTHFGVLSVQKSYEGFDGQLSYFTRYNNLHYLPDPVGDLLLNGIASTITRTSFTNGIQGDGSYQINSAHTIRAGFSVSGEQAFVGNTSLVEPCMVCDGSDNGAPESITDNVSKLGVLMGVYAQDEWKLTNQFTINAGLRFDQMYQFVSANQLSPRLSATYKPFENTTFHAGYARYFTPPTLVEAAPANIGLFANTTGAPNAGQANDPVQPERSHYFDAGVDQKIPLGCTASSPKDCSSLELGVDAYYKIATDLIDNGLFGQALVLSAFNYANGYNEGIEFHAKYNSGNFQAYANVAVAQQRASQVVSNQYLFNNTTPLADLGGLTEFQYIQTHFVYTDHNQFVTASAGALYQFCGGRPATVAETFGTGGNWWCGTKLSADMIYGSGLRAGDANIGTVPAYTQVNVGIKREFLLPNDPLPMTVRFDVVNLFDEIYEIRDGSGIGVFAPQFGPRRGFFLGISKKI
jgi:outer membrane receptor protein involved in Fe transport